MGLLDLFRGAPKAEPSATRAITADGAGVAFFGLDDPALLDYLRTGSTSAAGIEVTVDRAMRNPAVFRSVSLISESMGMLPTHLVEKETKKKARDHPLFRILHRRPNAWQTAYDFKTLMQQRVLVEGDGYARIIRSRNFVRREDTIVGLVPLDPHRVTPVQNADWTVSYRYQPAQGATVLLSPSDVFHLRGISKDGIRGISRVRQAADAIGLAIAADLALGRLYRNGSFINGYLAHPKTLSGEAIERLRAYWSSRFAGADDAGKTPILEEGLEYKLLGSTAKDAQSHETRGRQIEEIARIFGVPRPLLMIDETSWGSGIDVLGQFFVRYALNSWFEAWQQAAERSLLTDEEADRYEIKFNAGALLRGSMKDQADFFAKALGAGGQQAWMTPNEVRETLDMPSNPDGDRLGNPMMGHNGGPPLNDNGAPSDG
ncbi:MAG TPA: phage portal protein [Methylorubrum populi]|uniref:Phage portal protein n=1 Tax=Methylorubrum populi TaxID=223967 RepID=A0A921E4K1_9HYPH|nr:phage portal protein [Methylorubrum populi]